MAEKKEEEKPVQKRIKSNPPVKVISNRPEENAKVAKTVVREKGVSLFLKSLAIAVIPGYF